MVYIYIDSGMPTVREHQLKYTAGKTYLGEAETRAEGRKLLKEYYSRPDVPEDYGMMRKRISDFLSVVFPEQGKLNLIRVGQFTEVWDDDDEFPVRFSSDSGHDRKEIKCFDNAEDAIEFAKEFEADMARTVDSMFEKTTEDIDKIRKEYGSDITEAALKDLMNELKDRIENKIDYEEEKL